MNEITDKSKNVYGEESHLGQGWRVEAGRLHVHDHLAHNIFVGSDDTDAYSGAHNFAKRIQPDYAAVGVEREERCRLLVQEMNKEVGIVLDNQKVVFLRQFVYFSSSLLR